MMNWKWARITGYVGLLNIVVAILAQVIAAIVPDYRNIGETEEIIRWGRYLWSYATISLGVLLEKKTGKWLEIVWGSIAGGLCLIPGISSFVFLSYSFRAFRILDEENSSFPF
ncbi:MAG TPA: hypothetical protein VN379_23615 [Sporomusa sp.]|jgi:hypothetical protein|nr:hypothetical protein [Sporomusa sp.]